MLTHASSASRSRTTTSADEDSRTVSGRLAAFAAATTFERLPRPVVDVAKGRLLDAFATAFAARDLPVPAVARAFVGDSAGKATILASTHRCRPVDAAFVNGTLVNGCTHDDYIGKLHAGAVVVPAALAMAEEHRSSGRELLTSVVIGYEIGARAYFGGAAMHPRFRGTGVAGAVAAAAAAAKAAGLAADRIADALGLSTMFASGIQEGFVSGTMDVKLNVGWASRSGVSAAQLVQCGATAAPAAFEGNAGFFQAFAGSADGTATALDALGQRFLIEDTLFKERPMCIFVQTPVQLAHEIAKRHDLAARGIERVVARVPIATLNNPGHQNVAPFDSQLQARISARFTIAAALLGRPVETYRYFDNFADADVIAMMDRIEVIAGPDDSTVELAVESGGETYRQSGGEMDQLTASLDKSLTKFDLLLADFPESGVERVRETVLRLEEQPDAEGLTAALRALTL